MMRFALRSKPVAKKSAPVGPDTINLSGGFAFPDCLPDVSREAAIAATDYRLETMQYSGTVGLDDMRDQVVAYVARDGVKCERENVLIVNGAKHGLDLACRIMLDPGDSVIVTSPTYITALSILRTFEVKWLTVGQDNDGIDVAELEAKLTALEKAGEQLPKLLFDVPDFHNPTGITTTVARRRKLVELAKRFEFIIVEDDPYRKVRFEGTPVPPIKSFDDGDVVIAVGTASKILAPGLRIGWVIASPDIVARMAAQKSDGGSSAFTQRIFVELMKNGQIDHHVKEVTDALRHHRDAMVQAFAAHMPDAKVRKPEGGYYLWAELPEEIDSDKLVGLGIKHKVAVYSGTLCFAEAPRTNFLRLCYSFVTPSEIEEGVRRLAAAYAELKTGLSAEQSDRMAKEARAMATY